MRRHLVGVLLLALVFLTGCIGAVTRAPLAVISTVDNAQRRGDLTEAAAKGDVYAQFALAESYCCTLSHGLLSGKKAMRYYCDAAKNGFAQAQLALGKIYEGEKSLPSYSVAPDDSLAYMWYSVAAKRADLEAAQSRDRMWKKMTAIDRKIGKELVKEWRLVRCFEEGA